MSKYVALGLFLGYCFGLGGFLAGVVYANLSKEPCFVIPPPEAAAISITTLRPMR